MIVLEIDNSIKEDWLRALKSLIEDANAYGLKDIVGCRQWNMICPDKFLYAIQTAKRANDLIDYITDAINDDIINNEFKEIIIKICDSAKNVALKKKELMYKVKPQSEIDEDYKNEIKSLLLSKQKNAAIFSLSEKLLETEYIYTIRDDEKEEMWIYDDGIYIPNGKCFVREFCKNVCDSGYSKSISIEVIAHVVASTYINMNDFFSVQNVDEIAVKNGILNLKTRELKPFSPEYKFFSKVNAEYKEDGKYNERMISFLHDVVSKEDAVIIQELFGYLLYKKYIIAKAVLFNGEGGNGKSRILELIRRFIGLENCVDIEIKSLSENDFLASEMFLKSACIGADISDADLKHTGTFKKLIGGDLITANRKFKNPVSFVNYAKLIFNANKIPHTADTSEGFFRRWIIINFPHKFYPKEEIERLSDEEKEKIKVADNEIVEKIVYDGGLDGILIWALDGLDRLLKNSRFSYSLTTKEIEIEYMMRSDSFSVFCDKYIEDNAMNFIPKEELRQGYKIFCMLHNVPLISDMKISKFLKERFFPQTERKTVNDKFIMCWSGISFKPEFDVFREENIPTIKGIKAINTFPTYRKSHKNFSTSIATIDSFDTLDNSVKNTLIDDEKYAKKSLIDELLRSLNGCELPKSELIEKFGGVFIDQELQKGTIFEPKTGWIRKL